MHHFCNAVKSSGTPSQILRILAESLPPQVFNLIIRQLDGETGVKVGGPSKSSSSVRTTTVGPGGISIEEERTESFPRSGGPTVTLVDDDVE